MTAKLTKTCFACPEQYDVVTPYGTAYFRLRHGRFSIDVPDTGGTEVYEAHPEGDGAFVHEERDGFLRAGLMAVYQHYGAEFDGSYEILNDEF